MIILVALRMFGFVFYAGIGIILIRLTFFLLDYQRQRLLVITQKVILVVGGVL